MPLTAFYPSQVNIHTRLRIGFICLDTDQEIKMVYFLTERLGNEVTISEDYIAEQNM